MKKLTSHKTIVIKIGSSLIVNDKDKINLSWLKSLAKEIAKLQKSGVKVILVSSGAIACASRVLGKKRKDLDMDELQAYASYGQGILIENLKKSFAKARLEIAQLLITSDDCQNRRRYLNMRATLNKLLEMNIVPIINENDSITTDEIKFGDNDGLSSEVAMLINADLLILLSDVNGVYDKNPKLNRDAKIIRKIDKIGKNLLAGCKEVDSYGTGGMFSKLQAANKAQQAGVSVIITAGKDGILKLDKDKEFSFFAAKDASMSARKKWLSQLKIKGEVVINKDAVKVIKKGKSSLLPVGVVALSGKFERGDVVAIMDGKNKAIAKAIANLSNKELDLVKGKNSKAIQKINPNIRTILAHIDNMVII